MSIMNIFSKVKKDISIVKIITQHIDNKDLTSLRDVLDENIQEQRYDVVELILKEVFNRHKDIVLKDILKEDEILFFKPILENNNLLVDNVTDSYYKIDSMDIFFESLDLILKNRLDVKYYNKQSSMLDVLSNNISVHLKNDIDALIILNNNKEDFLNKYIQDQTYKNRIIIMSYALDNMNEENCFFVLSTVLETLKNNFKPDFKLYKELLLRIQIFCEKTYELETKNINENNVIDNILSLMPSPFSYRSKVFSLISSYIKESSDTYTKASCLLEQTNTYILLKEKYSFIFLNENEPKWKKITFFENK